MEQFGEIVVRVSERHGEMEIFADLPADVSGDLESGPLKVTSIKLL